MPATSKRGDGAFGLVGLLILFAVVITLLQRQPAGAEISTAPEAYYLTADQCPNLLMSRSQFTYGDDAEQGTPGQVGHAAIHYMQVTDRHPGASLRPRFTGPQDQVFTIVARDTSTLGVIHLTKVRPGWRVVQLQECS